MYGDIRHIFVMQSELENEIDYDDMQHSADKYSKAFNVHNQRQNKAKKTVADRKNVRSDAEPYFRPAQRPSAINSKQKTKPPKIPSSEQADSSALLDNLIKSNLEAFVEDAKMKKENFSADEVSKKSTILTSLPSSSTTPWSVSTSKSSESSNEDETSATTVVDTVVPNVFSNISSPLPPTPASTLETSPSTPAVDESTEKLSITLKNESGSLDVLEKVEEELEKEVLNDLEQLAASGEGVLAESDTTDRNNSKEPQTTTTETQLFQDTVQKDKDQVPIMNRRGV